MGEPGPKVFFAFKSSKFHKIFLIFASFERYSIKKSFGIGSMDHEVGHFERSIARTGPMGFFIFVWTKGFSQNSFIHRPKGFFEPVRPWIAKDKCFFCI